jgi:hypothetical protein
VEQFGATSHALANAMQEKIKKDVPVHRFVEGFSSFFRGFSSFFRVHAQLVYASS